MSMLPLALYAPESLGRLHLIYVLPPSEEPADDPLHKLPYNRLWK